MIPVLGSLLLGSLSLLGPPDSAAAAIDRYLRDQLRRAHVPGAFVAVIRTGRTVFAKAYGTANLEWNRPVTPRSPFQIASVTKLITSVVLASLVEDGKIRLDDSVNRYLPDPPDSWRGITLKQLAQHVSGMAPGPVDPGVATTLDGVRAATKTPLATEPGRRSQYGSLDYTVLQYVIERVTGQPFPAVVKSRVLDRIGARCSAFDEAEQTDLLRSADPIPERVTTYQWSGTANRQVWFLYPRYAYAAGGLFACGADLIRLVTAIDAGALIPRSLRAAWWTAPTLADSSLGEFGVGWTVTRYRGRPAVGHSGGPALADVMYLPTERLGIIVLTNQLHLLPELADGIAGLFLPAPATALAPAIPDSIPAITSGFDRILRGMRTGALDSAWFAPAARKDLLPAMREWGPVSVGLYDPLTRLELLEDAAAGPLRRRRYRATFGSKVVEYDVEASPDGKLARFNPRR
jgi:CubicO group peptidase (beta-lactamase class C family)